MELGFIQTAPASSLAPLADASTPAASIVRPDGAFDDALAATLQAVEKNAGGRTAPAKGTPSAAQGWELSALFMASSLASPAAESGTSEVAATTDESVATDDASAETEAADSTDAALDLVVPTPVVGADVKVAVVPQDATAVQAATPVIEEATLASGVAPVPADPMAALQGREIGGARQEQPAGEVAPQQPAAASAPKATAQTVAQSGEGMMAAATTGNASSNEAASAARAASAEAPAALPDAAATVKSGVEASRAQARSQIQAVRPEFVDQTAQTTAQNAAAAQAASGHVAPPVTASIEPAASQPAGNAASAAKAESADAGVPQFEIASDVISDAQAGMTGDEQSGGQSPRPSPEFMRFAAALAQVTPASDEARGAAAVVTPTSASAGQAAHASATAPVATAAPTGATDTLEAHGAENVGRLVQAMRVISRPGAWEATVRLNPEHLGDVSIALRVERNSVSAVVNAEAAGVRQWLESQEQAVRSGMAEHGLNLDRFIVQRDGQRREADSQQQQESPRRQPRQRQATSQRFEIVV